MSKSYYDVSYHNGSEAVYLNRYSNNTKGFKLMLKDLFGITRRKRTSWFICFENTGVYSKELLYWLLSKDIACCEENALRVLKSLGLRRGKDDKVDSKDICRYVFEKRDSIKRTATPDFSIVRLKKLLSRRSFLIKQRTALITSITDQDKMIEKDLFEYLEDQTNILIEEYTRQIKAHEKDIEQLLSKNEKMKKNDELLKTICGIGPITSATLIAKTENFSCFKEARKFACYCGVAPFPNRSGIKKGRTKVSHLASKSMKGLLSNGAIVAVVHDKELRTYYQRKITEGKGKGSVLNAVKNKLIARAFAVIKRQTPYVHKMTYA